MIPQLSPCQLRHRTIGYLLQPIFVAFTEQIQWHNIRLQSSYWIICYT